MGLLRWAAGKVNSSRAPVRLVGRGHVARAPRVPPQAGARVRAPWPSPEDHEHQAEAQRAAQPHGMDEPTHRRRLTADPLTNKAFLIVRYEFWSSVTNFVNLALASAHWPPRHLQLTA
jgi:hypothetical protein